MNIELPLKKEDILKIKAGSLINLNGVLYTARDQAHKRLIEMLEKNKPLPFALEGALIYYCGPTPIRSDNLFGSAGPTTSSRMDPFTIELMKNGLAGTIGKGQRSEGIQDGCRQFQSIYFITFGGLGAYLAKRIEKQEIIAFPDLGTEAIYKLTVKDFPVIAAYDANGFSIFS